MLIQNNGGKKIYFLFFLCVRVEQMRNLEPSEQMKGESFPF